MKNEFGRNTWGRKGVVPTGGVDLKKGRDAAAKVKARSSNLIACGANPDGVPELVETVG